MLQSIPAPLFFEWFRFYTMDPFGEERQDLRFAQFMAIYCESHRDPKKKSDPFQPKDFMPYWDDPSDSADAGKDKSEVNWRKMKVVTDMMVAMGYGISHPPPSEESVAG